MKISIAILGAMLALLPTAALAQSATGVGIGIGQADANSSSRAAAISRSTNNFFYPANTTNSSFLRQGGSIRTVPSVSAPGLAAAGIESCNSSFSAGGSWLGGGLSFGGPIMDHSCNRRLNARTLWAFGYRSQALNVMLNEPEVAAAFQQAAQTAYAPVNRRKGYQQISGPGYLRSGNRFVPQNGDLSMAQGPKDSRGITGHNAGCQRFAGGVVGAQCLD